MRRASEDPSRPIDFRRSGRSRLVDDFSSFSGEGYGVTTGEDHISNESLISISDVRIRPTVDVKLVGRTRMC